MFSKRKFFNSFTMDWILFFFKKSIWNILEDGFEESLYKISYWVAPSQLTWYIKGGTGSGFLVEFYSGSAWLVDLSKQVYSLNISVLQICFI